MSINLDDFSVTIDDQKYYANDLARMTGAGYPDHRNSVGAMWLLEIADTYAVERENIRTADYPADYLSELTDNAADVQTHEAWQIFTDLTLYQYASEFLGEEGPTAKGFLERGPGSYQLYEVASNLFSVLYQTHDMNREDESE